MQLAYFLVTVLELELGRFAAFAFSWCCTGIGAGIFAFFSGADLNWCWQFPGAVLELVLAVLLFSGADWNWCW